MFTPRPFHLHWPRASCALLTCGVCLLAGCQSYEPKPLDVTAARHALVERSAASEQVAEFARRLAEADAAAVPSDFNPADGLSLAEAEVVALVYNPELRLARLQAGVAKATADTAGIWEDPVTGFNLNDVLQHNGSVTMGAQISLTIPISGRLEVEKDRANAAYLAQLAQVQAAEWNTRMELRRAWSAWTTTQQRAQVVKDTAVVLAEIAGIAERMERVGEMPRVEARLFKIERATHQAELERLRAAQADEEVAIKRIMGLAAWSTVQLVPGQLPAGEAVALESLRDQMVERSPILHALRASYEVAERTLEREVREQYPDIEIGPTYNTDGNEDFTFGVQFPLPLWNHNQQGVAEAGAERELLRARFETTVELQLAELQSTSVVYESAVTQRRLVEEEIVPLVDTQDSETRRIAQLGEVNTLLLLESLTRHQEAKLSLIEARRAEALAFLRITHLVGPAPRVVPALAEQTKPREPLP